jgi:hypothetical protein
MPYRDPVDTRRRRAEHYAENKAEIAQRNARWAKSPAGRRSNMRSRIACTYSIRREWFDERLIAQGGRCDMCHEPMAGPTEPCVDHEHETGRVRGLLCAACNKALGHIEDVAWSHRAKDYLVRHGSLAPPHPQPDTEAIRAELTRRILAMRSQA